ncbi:hypothetical protein BBO99_00005311 [Phytophthora kernoviae]|uniref:FYVE-type domain-containing protein n=1 Tax=Phytophthora kernoviae TaxID=325452 RepID=A0A3R7HAC4_9STRA|nr:hypothetical protein JM16_005239 [Phytophthora kernoviae]RLN43615.1 hypothetical protein BBI17_005515 [Phytophthora kernoviae]RLN79367.1 hypothetical protein BBO99_00005311 [Phytophthora kernoviae]
MKKIFDKQFENGALVDSLSCTTPPPFAPIPDNKGRNGGWQLFSEDDGYNVFEQTYLSDKLQRVGRRAARHPQRQQLVQSSRLIGVHTLSSMNFKDIPELPKSSKTDRLHFRNTGVVIEETEGDAGGPLVRVSLFLSLMPSKLILKEVSQSPRMRAALSVGSEVTKKYRKWLQTLAVGVTHLVQTAKPSVTMQHLTKMMWAESDHCFLCHKNFRTYRRRHHCRFCGEAICGSSVAPSLKTAMDDDEHMDLMYKRGSNWEPSMGNRSSYATTTNTNEGSNHSQFRFANMTAQEKQIAERLIREANAQGNSRADGRPPLITRHQSQYQPDYEMSPVHLASKKAHHMTRAATSPSPSPSLHSMNSSHSSGSAHSDLIQLIIPAKDPEEADFIVFDNSRQTEGFRRSDASNDMIPLSF